MSGLAALHFPGDLRRSRTTPTLVRVGDHDGARFKESGIFEPGLSRSSLRCPLSVNHAPKTESFRILTAPDELRVTPVADGAFPRL